MDADVFDFEDRIITNEYSPEDADAEVSLRPRRFDEYVGQDKTKEILKIYIDAVKMRGEALDHVLLYGPPGLGKTTLSGIIAAELGVKMRVTSGPAIEKPGDLVAILTSLEKNEVLFIDEIHRLSRTVEEILYPAMEDYSVDIIIGKENDAALKHAYEVLSRGGTVHYELGPCDWNEAMADVTDRFGVRWYIAY